MSSPTRLCLTVLAAVALAVPPARADFPLKDGDVWVMAGDSITQQHLHSNYFEAFCYARYPKMKFGFRNSGVGGHTVPTTLARFDYDIAAWKPTIVSVELGMNDQNSTPTEKFVNNMDTMVKRIRSLGARPVILSPSPINNGQTLATLSGSTGNKRLHDYAEALKEYSAKNDIPYADQFHPLLEVWGRNKSYESLGSVLMQVKMIAANDKLEGVEHLRAFLALHDRRGARYVSMQGDPVHPGAPGQLMMAAALLKALGAESFVSSAAIDVADKKIDAKGCVVENLVFGEKKIEFDRLDERLPFPIPEDARSAVAFDPTILQMSQYLLKVTGLKTGNYDLAIDGGKLGTVASKDLEAGINLTAFGPGSSKSPNPIAAQSKAILEAVSARAKLVNQWRSLSKAANVKDAHPEAKNRLEEQTKRVIDGDNAIREAARPRKMHVELTAAP